MYDQTKAEQLHPYSEEEQHQRQHDIAFPEWRPIIIDGKDTGYTISNTGECCNPKGLILKPHAINSGYLTYNIYGVCTLAHRLVAIAFVPNPDSEHKIQVNHINSNRQDNWYKNLEWVTQSENMRHSVESGFLLKSMHRGSDRPGAKHTETDVRKVCELFEKGYRPAEVVKATGFSMHFVYGILKGKKWSHISKNYNLIDRCGEPLYTEQQIHECCKYLSECKSNRWIAEKMGIPRHMPAQVRKGNLRPDISSQYTFPQTPQRDGVRSLPIETVHKICRLLELDVGVTEITRIFPEIGKANIHQIKNGKQYRDISRQYKIPGPTKVKGVKTGRVQPGTSKSGKVARLNVGYDYDRVIAALTDHKPVTTVC